MVVQYMYTVVLTGGTLKSKLLDHIIKIMQIETNKIDIQYFVRFII